jgi:hypothetical protein
VVDIGVSYHENVDEVMAAMAEVGAQLRTDPTHAARMLADLEIAGVERLDDSAVVLRCRFKVAPLQQRTIRREFLRRLKAAFDDKGIDIPFRRSMRILARTGKRLRCPCAWHAITASRCREPIALPPESPQPVPAGQPIRSVSPYRSVPWDIVIFRFSP